jgi:hypothetical protein
LVAGLDHRPAQPVQRERQGYRGEEKSLLADSPKMPRTWPARAHHFGVTTALAIGLVLATWTVLPFPLAVLVGRSLRAEPVAEVGTGLEPTVA